MITQLKIRELRGITQGELTGVSPLSVLVGPNSSGKSTILDALLIGANPFPAEGVGLSIRRRPWMPRGVRWLFRQGNFGNVPAITATVDGKEILTGFSKMQFTQEGASLEVTAKITTTEDEWSQPIEIDNNNAFSSGTVIGSVLASDLPGIRLVGTFAGGPPTHQLFSLASERGRKREVVALAKELIPALDELLILTEAEKPVLHLGYSTGSVPAALSGDGVQALLRIILEMAALPAGTVLLEEPEAHLHPKAIWLAAQAIVAAVKRDIQVILTTHSLEFIDAVLDAARDCILDRVCLMRTALADRKLRISRLSGEEALFSRRQIEDDLR